MSTDLLGSLSATTTPRRATWPVLLIGAAATAIAVTGTAFAVSLSGGGPQPEDVLPAGAVAFAKVDLDPGADQKLAIYELVERFPQAADEIASADSLRDDVLRLLVEGGDVDLDYDDDVRPWVGDRVGVAVVPGDDPEQPDAVVALAHDDGRAAGAALERAGEGDLAYEVLDEWVLVASSQAALDAALETDRHLADDEAFRDAVDELDGGQLLTAWTDLGRVWDAVPDGLRDEVTSQSGLERLDPAGTVTLGLHVEDAAVELVSLARDVATGLEADDAELGEGSGLVRDLPSEAVLAVSVTGLGAGLAEGYDDLVDSLEQVVPDLEATVDELGLDLPGDLVAVLGDETAAAVWGSDDDPRVLVRTRTDEPDDALEVLERLVPAAFGVDLDGYAKEVDGGVAVGTKDEVAAAEDGGLGDVDAFREAVPDAEDAALVVWVDVEGALRTTGTDAPDGVDELRAVGLTVSGDADDADLRLRVLFRG